MKGVAEWYCDNLAKMMDIQTKQEVAEAGSASTLDAAALEHAPHRFAPVTYQGVTWDLSHLDPFSFSHEVVLDKTTNARRVIELVFIFSCHCFTHDAARDPRNPVPSEEMFVTPDEVRVLNKERYDLSRTVLLGLIKTLPSRKIIVAVPGDNYVTFERRTELALSITAYFLQSRSLGTAKTA